MNTSKPLLEIRDLTKRYGGFEALSGVSLDLRDGEIISVLGPSGCGKSTLLQLVAGLARPDGGEIRLDGKTIASQGTMVPPEKRGVNMVFQDYALWPHMNVFENISYGLKNIKMDKETMKHRVLELMRMLHLDGLNGRLPPQLSGGQQQRVAIARALATRPRLMLLDEPLSNLDMRLRIEMRTEMAYLFRQLGMSVFHVTHDPDEAFAMADRLLILRGGKIDQFGSPEECYRRPASRWVASLLGAINRVKGEIVRTPEGMGLKVGSTVLTGLAGAKDEALTEGKPAEILYRPEDLILFASDGSNRIELRVKYCTFEGKRWRCIAESPDGSDAYLLSERPLERGTLLHAALPKEAAYLYIMEEGLSHAGERHQG